MKCRDFDGKTDPFPMVQFVHVVTGITTVQIQMEPDVELNWN
jgi:hypothetical protein